MDRLKNKVAVVTGGALGIGQSVCLHLAQEGAQVAVTDVLDAEGQQVAERIRSAGGSARFWHLDVSNESEVRDVLQQVNTAFKKIGIIVNNAGISGANKPTHETTEQEWDHLMGVNVKGVFFCTKHVIPYMKANRGGSIINLSSIYGIVGAGDIPAYHASKGAVRLMTKNDAITYAPDKIRVNSVHPGFIWTPLVERFSQSFPGGVEKARKQLASKHPIGEIGRPEDVAWAVVYLASDESRFVTGSELVVDGGYTAQ